MSSVLHKEIDRDIDDVRHSQKVRLYGDILIFAPYLMYLAYKGRVTSTDRAVLAVLAVWTFAYNYRNLTKPKPGTDDGH
jgi:hypothetical protein